MRTMFSKAANGAVTGFLLLAAILPGNRCLAQTVAIAQISGNVKDPSGAAVADAQVKATQTNTRLVRQVATDSSGAYIFPPCQSGLINWK